MTDPAIEAAQRHVDALAYGWNSRFRRDNLIAAAREALKPVRELHHRVDDGCSHCWDGYNDAPQPWPCETAKRIYSTKELTGR